MTDDQALLIVEDLFASWYSSVLRYASRICGNVELAEDVVQEAFLCLCRDLLAGHQIDSPKGWTLKVVRRLLMKGMGYEKRNLSDELIEEGNLPSLQVYPSFEQEVEFDEVTRLFFVLTPREEEVVLLRLEAMNYRDIGETLGIRPQSVHVLLSRAVVKLRKAIDSPKLKNNVPKTH